MEAYNEYFPLLINIAAISGFVATTLALLRLRDSQRSHPSMFTFLLIAVAICFLIMRTMELPTLYETSNNGIREIPPTTSIRMGLQALWYWLIYRTIFKLVDGTKERQV